MLSITEETQNYRKAFHAYFYNNILKNLQKFEVKRKSTCLKYQILVGLTVLSFCFAIGYMLWGVADIQNKGNIAKIVMALGVGLFMIARNYKKSFEKEVKTGVINSFLSFFGNFYWSMDECIPKEDIEYSRLIGNFSTIRNDDFFKGLHDGVKITISEMTLLRKNRFEDAKDTFDDPLSMVGNNDKNSDIVFDGLFIKLDINKLLNSHTIIIENTPFVDKFFSALPNNFQGMEKVELEDPDFNKQFSVFSEDQTEARYILTTTFMERFKHLKDIFATNHIRASFQNNSILIAICCDKDLFVLGDVTKPVTDTQEVQTLFEEFAAVLSLIEILKLNMKLNL